MTGRCGSALAARRQVGPRKPNDRSSPETWRSVQEWKEWLPAEEAFGKDCLALQAVEPGGFFARLWDIVLMWIAKLFSA